MTNSKVYLVQHTQTLIESVHELVLYKHTFDGTFWRPPLQYFHVM